MWRRCWIFYLSYTRWPVKIKSWRNEVSSTSTKSTNLQKSENRSITRECIRRRRTAGLIKNRRSFEASVPPLGGRKHPYQNTWKSIPIISCSSPAVHSWTGTIIKRRMKSNIIASNATTAACKSGTNIFNYVQTDDLIKFGLIPELVGRFPVIASWMI